MVTTLNRFVIDMDYPVNDNMIDPLGIKRDRCKKGRKVIFVSGAFRAPTQWGITQNVRRAEEISLQLWKQGYVVICPHTMTQHFQDVLPDIVWLRGCLELIRRCDAIFMMKGWAMSEGAKEEEYLAKSLGLEIIYETLRRPEDEWDEKIWMQIE